MPWFHMQVSAQLLVLLHGLGHTPQSWQEQVTSLPSGMKAVAPWLLGCRPGTSERFEVGRAADTVLALLNQYGVEQVALCGHSLGAVVALAAAIRTPTVVSHLVLAGGLVKQSRLATTVQRVAMATMLPARFAEAGLSKATLQQILDELGRVDFRRSLGSVTARTLVIHGQLDQVNLPAARRLVAGISGARMELIPGAGQQPQLEAAAEFSRLLYGFLAS